MIKAVIIDLDDTLCLTEAVCFDMENDVLKKMGRPPMTRKVHKANWGKPLFEAILERSPGVDVADFKKAYEPIIKEYIGAGRLDAISNENLKALDALAKAGKKLVVLTSRTHTELSHMLEADHYLYERIETFYYRDNMQFHKPDPRAFAHLESEHGWRPGECVYVGDSVSDAQAATGAGIHFVASLESGLRNRSDFDDYHVAVFIDTFPEVVEAIQQLDAQLQLNK